MTPPDWKVRPARRSDRELLGRFACADHTVPWEREVEYFIRHVLYEWAFGKFAKKNDPRLLLLFDRKTGELVGVAAHERTALRYGKQKPFAATKLEVVAIERKWQGRRFTSGDRAIDVLLSTVMTDVANRVPPRHARVFAVVHEQNSRSIAVLVRHGLVNELSRVDPRYRRLVTARAGRGS